jgi:predicted nucleotide-binding protein
MKKSKIINNAVKILGHLINNNAMAGGDIKLKEIFNSVGLPEKEFDSADTYLLQQKYVQGTMGGMDGSRWLTGRGVDFYEENSSILEITSNKQEVNHMPDAKKVFIVHGRDSRLRDDFFSFLRALGLQPIEWSEALKLTGKATPYTGEAVESAFKNAQAVIVLLSPDDEVRLSPELWKDNEDENEKEIRLQARPNVLFEAGMAFGTHHDRTLLVEVGQLKAFSDVAGRHVVRLSNSSDRRNEIAERLRTAGCDVSTSGNDWLNTGDFNVIRKKMNASSSYDAKDLNEEELYEEYGVYWNKELRKRCLQCKSPLKYASDINSPSVFFCSKCNCKHVLKDTKGNLITEQQAIEKLRNANFAASKEG